MKKCENCANAIAQKDANGISFYWCNLVNSLNLSKMMQGKIKRFEYTTTIVAPDFTCPHFIQRQKLNTDEKVENNTN